jgi:hypothetical protein
MTSDRREIEGRAVATEDPTEKPVSGLSFQFQSLLLQVNSKERNGSLPLGALEGALLTVSFRDDVGHHTYGSAIMVAPGIALAAAHVIRHEDYYESFQRGNASAVCMGFARDGGQLWDVHRITLIDDTDLAILGLKLRSAIPSSGTFSTAHMTTRMPAVGEELLLCGFSADALTQPRAAQIAVTGDFRFARGEVLDVFQGGADRVMVRGPSLAMDCDAAGGMSGGPVFDARGYLLGIISTSIAGMSATIVSHAWPALVRGQVEPVWPVGRAPAGKQLLLGLGSKFGLMVERPDAFDLVALMESRETGIRYKQWT